MARQADIMKSKKAITWNIRHVRTDKHEISEIPTKHGADIIVLHETHLEIEQRFTLDPYTVYRNKGQQRRRHRHTNQARNGTNTTS